jgi:hypothetical protein
MSIGNRSLNKESRIEDICGGNVSFLSSGVKNQLYTVNLNTVIKRLKKSKYAADFYFCKFNFYGNTIRSHRSRRNYFLRSTDVTFLVVQRCWCIWLHVKLSICMCGAFDHDERRDGDTLIANLDVTEWKRGENKNKVGHGYGALSVAEVQRIFLMRIERYLRQMQGK